MKILSGSVFFFSFFLVSAKNLNDFYFLFSDNDGNATRATICERFFGFLLLFCFLFIYILITTDCAALDAISVKRY